MGGKKKGSSLGGSAVTSGTRPREQLRWYGKVGALASSAVLIAAGPASYLTGLRELSLQLGQEVPKLDSALKCWGLPLLIIGHVMQLRFRQSTSADVLFVSGLAMILLSMGQAAAGAMMPYVGRVQGLLGCLACTASSAMGFCVQAKLGNGVLMLITALATAGCACFSYASALYYLKMLGYEHEKVLPWVPAKSLFPIGSSLFLFCNLESLFNFPSGRTRTGQIFKVCGSILLFSGNMLSLGWQQGSHQSLLSDQVGNHAAGIIVAAAGVVFYSTTLPHFHLDTSLKLGIGACAAAVFVQQHHSDLRPDQ